MALSKRYFTVQGEIIGEKASGGSRVDYLTDALGSVTATVDQNAQVINNYRYKPYGAQLAKTGAGADPRFRWVGGRGYRLSGMRFSDVYVRARHYASLEGRWATMDPSRHGQRDYLYSSASPCTHTDSSGRWIDFLCGGDDKQRISDCCSKLPRTDVPADSESVAKIIRCMAKKGWEDPFTNEADIVWFLRKMSGFCDSPGSRVCVRCFDRNDNYPGWPTDCWNPCKDRNHIYYGYTSADAPSVPAGLLERCDLRLILEDRCEKLMQDDAGKPCDCGIILCSRGIWGSDPGPCAVLWHELMHCTGIGHLKGGEVDPRIRISRKLDFIYKLSCCICVAAEGQDKCGEECKRFV